MTVYSDNAQNRFSFCVQPEVFTPVHVNSTTGLTKGVHLSVPQIDFPVISHDSALEALQRFIKSHMCCHRSVLKNLRILHVFLNVRCESRNPFHITMALV